MAKVAKELSPIEVSRLTKVGTHAVGGVAGLTLQIQGANSRSWILRTVVGIKRKEFGLGAYPEVGVGEARNKAREIKAKVAQGICPLEERNTALAMLRANQAKPDFAKCASDYIATHSVKWRNSKHVSQWENTIETYANPILGAVRIDLVTQEHVLQVLEPIWNDKPETASRLQGRIENILAWAAAKGFRTPTYNPAKWRGQLDKILPTISKRLRIKHHAALPYNEIGTVVKSLQESKAAGAKVLLLTILTAVRPAEARGATWGEFDLEKKVWTIPAARMKAKVEHEVPLSDEAVALIESVPVTESPLLFPSRNLTVMSDVTVTKLLRTIADDVTVHGFRSTFRDWASEETNFQNEVCEQALAHTIGNLTEAAYRRGNLFGKRRELMQAWANYCFNENQSNVIPLKAKA